MSSRKQILIDQTDAKRVTVTGWVDSDGKFWGDDEQAAKYASCTHRYCRQCQAPTPKYYVVCESCKQASAVRTYESLPVEEWDGESPLYSDAKDEWVYYPLEYLNDMIADGVALDVKKLGGLRLLLCSPVKYPTLNEEYFINGYIEDDQPLPQELCNASVYPILNR